MHATELKDFLANICCESYSDLDKHRANVQYLEKEFPSYSEKTECEGKLVWGDVKLGRLPSFLYDDVVVWSMHTSHSVQISHSVQSSHPVQTSHFVQTGVVMDAANIADAENTKALSSVFSVFPRAMSASHPQACEWEASDTQCMSFEEQTTAM